MLTEPPPDLSGLLYFFSDQDGRNKIRNYLPGGVRGLCVIRRCLDGGDFAPAAYAVAHHFNEHDATVLNDAEAGLKRRLQRHPNLAQVDLFNSHAWPSKIRFLVVELSH